MRKYHRWLAVVFGVFLVWIALTGFGIQFLDLSQEGKHHEGGPAAAKPVAPAGFVCPKGWTCGPERKRDAAHETKEFVQHLHSGEAFGPLGVAISIASSIALLFFAFSGVWMYLQMWRGRRRGGKQGLFWG